MPFKSKLDRCLVLLILSGLDLGKGEERRPVLCFNIKVATSYPPTRKGLDKWQNVAPELCKVPLRAEKECLRGEEPVLSASYRRKDKQGNSDLCPIVTRNLEVLA